MIAVLHDHFFGILYRLALPVPAADVLPAGDLREDQQSQPVTFVDKVLALGVMGGTHRHTAQFVLQNTGILSLKLFGSRTLAALCRWRA